MKWLCRLAISSAWNRRFVLSLVLLSVALSTFLLLGIERIRTDVHDNFAQSVAGTDLIAGPRAGSSPQAAKALPKSSDKSWVRVFTLI